LVSRGHDTRGHATRARRAVATPPRHQPLMMPPRLSTSARNNTGSSSPRKNHDNEVSDPAIATTAHGDSNTMAIVVNAALRLRVVRKPGRGAAGGQTRCTMAALSQTTQQHRGNGLAEESRPRRVVDH